MAINLKLFPKPMTETTAEEMPTVTDPFSLMRPATTEFNLVRIVEEHGPKRLEQIDALITGYQEKIDPTRGLFRTRGSAVIKQVCHFDTLRFH
jgi:hypothetical protein